MNQFYTYREQKHLRGLDLIKRAFKAQLSSLSALLITYAIAQALVYFAHVNPYIAQPIGIIGAFFYNFAISNRFVFRPAPSRSTEGTTPVQEIT